MTLSLWRYAHLALAIISSLFLLILSVTGVILAIDAINEKTPAYRIDDFDSVSLAQSVPALSKVYPEIIELSVDHNGFVSLDASDADGNSVKAYVDPRNGQVLGPLKPKSQFIQWNIALHRSLFLKETGRIVVGAVSFLLLLIALSGTILIIKRQQGIRHFFAKINRDFFAQYFHVVTGRLFLVPVIIIALTGTYLFLVRIGLIGAANPETAHAPASVDEVASLEPGEFPVFQQTRLSEVEKLEFPFMPDDPDEHYVLKLRDRSLTISQLSGEVVAENRYPYSVVMEKLNLDLHTGRTNILWAIILGFASLNIIAFIYTGFEVTFRRTRTRIRNRFKAENAEIVVLAGSENGSTLFFANQVHQQLLADGKRSFIAEMNRYGSYPEARHMLVFTSTYGLGVAPANATDFGQLLEKNPQRQDIRFSVVGFGSEAYPDFCAYARHVDRLLEKQPWASRFLDLYTVNDKSAGEFTRWAHAWSEKSLVSLATAPALYQMKVTGLRKLSVVGKTSVSGQNSTFSILLKPESNTPFRSGDLLAIYPAGDSRERFYSIARNDGLIQLVVKLHPHGLGSGYLYQLEVNDTIKARFMTNPGFHFPEKAGAVAMIANGTGIAPFLGMIMENRKSTPLYLYAGFRHDNELTQQYRRFASEEIAKKHLSKFEIAFSRGESPRYVMDLIRENARFFADLLERNGTIMICGSLVMHKDVETILDEISILHNKKPLSYYKDNGRILSDCY